MHTSVKVTGNESVALRCSAIKPCARPIRGWSSKFRVWSSEFEVRGLKVHPAPLSCVPVRLRQGPSDEMADRLSRCVLLRGELSIPRRSRVLPASTSLQRVQRDIAPVRTARPKNPNLCALCAFAVISILCVLRAAVVNSCPGMDRLEAYPTLVQRDIAPFREPIPIPNEYSPTRPYTHTPTPHPSGCGFSATDSSRTLSLARASGTHNDSRSS